MADQNVVVSGGSLAGQSLADFHGPVNAINPVGSWDLNGNLVSVYGASLSLVAGTSLWSPAAALGAEAFAFNAASRLSQARQAALALTGAITVSVMVNVQALHASRAVIMEFALAGETLASNTLWRIGLSAGNRLHWFHEYGNGSNAQYDSTIVLPVGRWVHVLCTRAANGTSIKFYIDGIERDSATLASAPAGGTSALLSIGGHQGDFEFLTGMVSTPTVYGFQLGASQIESIANIVVPPELRP